MREMEVTLAFHDRYWVDSALFHLSPLAGVLYISLFFIPQIGESEFSL
jgi:hypothetical protein